MVRKFIDVTSTIERLEAFEARLGVSLEFLSVFVQDDGDGDVYLWVCGELQPQDGKELQEDLQVEIEATAYDASKRIIGTSSDKVSIDKIIGFEAFKVHVKLSVAQVSKVRIYPKKG